MAKQTSKTTRRSNAKASPKARKAARIENPFVRNYANEESKGSILFAALARKNGADLRDLADELGSSLASVRVRVAQLKREYNIEKIGEHGELVYRLVA